MQGAAPPAGDGRVTHSPLEATGTLREDLAIQWKTGVSPDLRLPGVRGPWQAPGRCAPAPFSPCPAQQSAHLQPDARGQLLQPPTVLLTWREATCHGSPAPKAATAAEGGISRGRCRGGNLRPPLAPHLVFRAITNARGSRTFCTKNVLPEPLRAVAALSLSAPRALFLDGRHRK